MYSLILKTFVSGRKVPAAPPFLVNSEFISNLKTKANYFDKSFDCHDGLSFLMLQMGSDCISKPLSNIFWNCLKAGYFLAVWKKTNAVPVHKKGNKEILNNYRTVSFSPILADFLKK